MTDDVDGQPASGAPLARVGQAGTGRLKVFLGAAPGVGKTYEMLSQGAALRRNGRDVVVGVIDTRGRRDTEALSRAHEIIPVRPLSGEGAGPAEMDLDAILARRPSLVLVDELAHSNAPGSRHPERYQDVEELLAAGIDVYSTINVQHVESLNDIAASFTGVRVPETIPDRILEAAEIEVVDIPPDELIARVHEGKVQPPDAASRGVFTKGNLSALRELALRRAAQAVDAQMLDHVRSHALPGNWAAGERILVAVSELAGADGLIRATKRIADSQKASWTAVHVETPRSRTLGEAEQQRLAAHLALATQLGGTVVTVPAASVVDGLKAHARDARATQLVVGKSARSKLFELRHGSVVDRLVRETPGLAVHVLPLDGGRAAATAPRHRRPGLWGRRSDYLWAALMVAAVTALASALSHVLNLGNVALLYLLPVMGAASLFGLRAGLFAGLLSSMAYNFVFLPPTGTLTISNPENVVTVVVLLGVALVTSQFAARVRSQADIAAASARANAALADFLRGINASANDEEIALTICGEVARLFDAHAVLVIAAPEGAHVQAACPPDHALGTIDRAAAEWALARGARAGRGSDTLTASDWSFYPIRSATRVHAALGIARGDGREPVGFDRLPLLMSLLDQAALGLERAFLERQMRDVAQLEERDRLRAALLSSVSHDLRTPLTTIVAASDALPAELAPELVGSIRAEANRLTRFVANLLDMARVEAGAMRLNIQPVDLTDAVAGAIHDTRHTLEGHPVALDIPPDLPLVRIDPQLLHHCLINLLDNAGRYADPGTPVTIRAERGRDQLSLSVLDQGPGLPPGREADVFGTFARFEGSDRSKGGTGLGLAIVKGFAEAMGVAVSAAPRGDPVGACFTLRFPERLLVGELQDA